MQITELITKDTNKADAVDELVGVLASAGKLQDKDKIRRQINELEEQSQPESAMEWRFSSPQLTRFAPSRP